MVSADVKICAVAPFQPMAEVIVEEVPILPSLREGEGFAHEHPAAPLTVRGLDVRQQIGLNRSSEGSLGQSLGHACNNLRCTNFAGTVSGTRADG